MRHVIDGGPQSPFVHTIIIPGKGKEKSPEDNIHCLNYLNPEWGEPDDPEVTLEVLKAHSQIALISAVNGRVVKENPPYMKFMCYSFCSSEDKQIITSYQGYGYDGLVIVEAWKEDKKSLLSNIDMWHIKTGGRKTPYLVINKHLSRIDGKDLQKEGVDKLAEKAFFDMLWNVPSR